MQNIKMQDKGVVFFSGPRQM
jgi:hypothetical protein